MLLFAGNVHAATAPRIVLIGIDAIPYRVVARLTDPALGERALFRGYHRPSAMISTFPSDTYVAWAGILAPFGVHKSHGYQPRYFDNAMREVQGGLSLVETDAPWEAFFDWRLEGVVRTAIAYGWPKKYSVDELTQGLAAFIASGKPVFAMYIVATDAIAHIDGPEALGDFLVELDKQLATLHRDHPDMPFYTVMISDHGVAGGEPLDNIWPALQDAMEKAGLHVVEQLRTPFDAVFVPYGLLSSFVIHTWPGGEAAAAKLVVAVPGVDLCVTRNAGGWEVDSVRGTALIGRRPGDAEAQWLYRPVSGDPLGYAPIVAQLRQQAARPDERVDAAKRPVAAEEWFADSSWFAATKDQFYPDALYRLAGSLSAVDNPGSVACSVSPGYMFGALKTEYVARSTIGRLKWTHGALYRDASLGFLLTDLPLWDAPGVVRFDRALVPLATAALKQNVAVHEDNGVDYRQPVSGHGQRGNE